MICNSSSTGFSQGTAWPRSVAVPNLGKRDLKAALTVDLCRYVLGKLQSSDLSCEMIRSTLVEFDEMEIDLCLDPTRRSLDNDDRGAARYST